LTFLFALFIQIGTNYANDYFDFVKGADTAERKGPKRAVQQGWVAPHQMLFAALLIFAAAFTVAVPLMIAAGLWSVPLAALCILFGILYTGGPKPLGYAGFGEILVFLFFGPIATIGTYFLQTRSAPLELFLASLAPGALSSAILLANNLRDERTDWTAGKKTLVVRFGAKAGQWIYVGLLALACSVPILLAASYFPPKLAAASLPFLFAPFRKVFTSVEALQQTSLLLLLYSILFCALIW